MKRPQGTVFHDDSCAYPYNPIVFDVSSEWVDRSRCQADGSSCHQGEK